MRAAGLLFATLLAACSGPRAAPQPQGAAPAPAPTAHHALVSVPKGWLETEPRWAAIVARLEPAMVGERWEQAANGCEHSRVAGRSRSPVDRGFSRHCTELGFGPVATHVFKLPTRMECGADGARLSAGLPWDTLTLTRTAPASCATLEPAWVRAEIKEVAPIIGDALPVASAWQREQSSSGALQEWELEWAAGAVDAAAIEARLDSLGYTLSSDQASYRLWTRRQPGTRSYTFARGGYRNDRVIVRRFAR